MLNLKEDVLQDNQKIWDTSVSAHPTWVGALWGRGAVSHEIGSSTPCKLPEEHLLTRLLTKSGSFPAVLSGFHFWCSKYLPAVAMPLSHSLSTFSLPGLEDWRMNSTRKTQCFVRWLGRWPPKWVASTRCCRQRGGWQGMNGVTISIWWDHTHTEQDMRIQEPLIPDLKRTLDSMTNKYCKVYFWHWLIEGGPWWCSWMWGPQSGPWSTGTVNFGILAILGNPDKTVRVMVLSCLASLSLDSWVSY